MWTLRWYFFFQSTVTLSGFVTWIRPWTKFASTRQAPWWLWGRPGGRRGLTIRASGPSSWRLYSRRDTASPTGQPLSLFPKLVSKKTSSPNSSTVSILHLAPANPYHWQVSPFRQLSKLWWMPSAVSKGFGPVMRLKMFPTILHNICLIFKWGSRFCGSG